MTDRWKMGRAPVLVNVTLILMGTASALSGAQQPGTASLVFDGVTVIDVERGKLVPDQRVVIAGNRITAVGSASTVKVPKSAQAVDARGKYLIPGLWDMHVHVAAVTRPPYVYKDLLINGVTGIREAGISVSLDSLKKWRQEVLDGVRVGSPRQIFSGLPVNGVCGRDRKQYGYCIANSADARRLVDSIQMAGSDMIKVRRLSAEMYFSVAAEARRRGIPIGGHGTETPPIAFSDSGGVILDHAQMRQKETGLLAVCIESSSASLEQCQRVAEQFRRNGTWFAPTLISYPRIGEGGGGPRSAVIHRAFKKEGRTFKKDSRGENWLRQLIDQYSAGDKAIKDSTGDSVGTMHLIQRVGMPVLAGSDIYPWGRSLHAELAMIVAEGLTPLSALQATTLNPAKALNATDSLGTVASGKLADLVLLSANPLVDITNTTTIHAVVANGRYFDRVSLDSLATSWP